MKNSCMLFMIIHIPFHFQSIKTCKAVFSRTYNSWCSAQFSKDRTCIKTTEQSPFFEYTQQLVFCSLHPAEFPAVWVLFFIFLWLFCSKPRHSSNACSEF
mmetsp:Transcript_20364/g.35026  ORF Transcript_20364/g.35026 Transcript_20364/m.35026 type:complete len:100 (-) Transcript_20364:162-461(-)